MVIQYLGITMSVFILFFQLSQIEITRERKGSPYLLATLILLPGPRIPLTVTSFGLTLFFLKPASLPPLSSQSLTPLSPRPGTVCPGVNFQVPCCSECYCILAHHMMPELLLSKLFFYPLYIDIANLRWYLVTVGIKKHNRMKLPENVSGIDSKCYLRFLVLVLS